MLHSQTRPNHSDNLFLVFGAGSSPATLGTCAFSLQKVRLLYPALAEAPGPVDPLKDEARIGSANPGHQQLGPGRQ